MRYTRAKLTWFGSIAFTVLALVGIAFKMEPVALAAIGGITTIITAYSASQGYTKGQFIKANPKEAEL